MTLIAYIKTVWNGKLIPPAMATDLNHGETGIKAATDVLDLETDAGRALTQGANAVAQKTTLGLENVTNTSDTNKPVSTEQQTALDLKVDKVTGYALSKNDLTDALKTKLDGIESGAQVASAARLSTTATGEAEVTAAPSHWWVLVGGALKRMTHAGWTELVLFATGKTNGATGYTLAGGTSSKTLTVDADASTSNVPTSTGKAFADASATALGTGITAAAVRRAGSTDADIGRVRYFVGAANAGLVLPAGGTWSYHGTRRGPTMQIIGAPYPITNMGAGAIAALDNQYFAFIDAYNDKLSTYKFDGAVFSLVGNQLTISGHNYPAMKALSSTTVALYDGGNKTLAKYSWNGTDWTLVGNKLTISAMGDYAGITMLDAATIALVEGTVNELRTYAFDGTNWAQVGSGLAIAACNNPAMCALSATRVAYVDQGAHLIQIYDWSGSAWSLQAGALNITGCTLSALAKISSTNFIEMDSTNKKIREYSYATGAVVQVGAGVAITGAGTPALGYLQPTFAPFGYIILGDATLDILTAWYYFGDMGREFEEIAGVAAGGTMVGEAVDGYYWSARITKEA